MTRLEPTLSSSSAEAGNTDFIGKLNFGNPVLQAEATAEQRKAFAKARIGRPHSDSRCPTSRRHGRARGRDRLARRRCRVSARPRIVSRQRLDGYRGSGRRVLRGGAGIAQAIAARRRCRADQQPHLPQRTDQGALLGARHPIRPVRNRRPQRLRRHLERRRPAPSQRSSPKSRA